MKFVLYGFGYPFTVKIVIGVSSLVVLQDLNQTLTGVLYTTEHGPLVILTRNQTLPIVALEAANTDEVAPSISVQVNELAVVALTAVAELPAL